MADKRLSKLQKWILNKCYEQLREIEGEKFYSIWRKQLVKKYCKEFKKGYYAESGDQVNISGIQVSITRSIRTLARKDLLYVFGCDNTPCIDVTRSRKLDKREEMIGDCIKWLSLSDEGVKLAKSLNVKE